MKQEDAIFVAGHRGLVGSAILEELRTQGYYNIITRTRSELDLSDMNSEDTFFAKTRPKYVFVAAAKVGGILANNTYRADFLYQNLAIQNAIIYSAYKYNVTKLLFLGSSCIYPKLAPQPIPESALLTSALEYTNEPYAIAKIAGLKLCESFALQYGCNFISVMPTNLYGENDNFNLETSHVLPALLRKIHLAKLLQIGDIKAIESDVQKSGKELMSFLDTFGITKDRVCVWGSGEVRREFLHTKDMARASVFVMQSIDFPMLATLAVQEGTNTNKESQEVRNTHLNIGYGSDITIRELAEQIRSIVGFKGELYFDISKPDGTPQKLMDSSKINALGWRAQITLEEGIKQVYARYCAATLG